MRREQETAEAAYEAAQEEEQDTAGQEEGEVDDGSSDESSGDEDGSSEVPCVACQTVLAKVLVAFGSCVLTLLLTCFPHVVQEEEDDEDEDEDEDEDDEKDDSTDGQGRDGSSGSSTAGGGGNKMLFPNQGDAGQRILGALSSLQSRVQTAGQPLLANITSSLGFLRSEQQQQQQQQQQQGDSASETP